MSITDYEIVTRLRMIALDEEVQRRWRREHRIAVVLGWLKRAVWPLATIVTVGAAVYELVRW